MTQLLRTKYMQHEAEGKELTLAAVDGKCYAEQTCYCCDQTGHKAFECPKLKNGNKQSQKFSVKLVAGWVIVPTIALMVPRMPTKFLHDTTRRMSRLRISRPAWPFKSLILS